MQKGIIRIMALTSLFFLSGCSQKSTDNKITFESDTYTVEDDGDIEIHGKVSGVTEGIYEANIDRYNDTIYIGKNGNFSIKANISNPDQTIFPLGIKVDDKNIVVGSVKIDTTLYSKAIELKEYISPNEVIALLKQATLTILNQITIDSDQFSFDFEEGVSFTGSNDISNNRVMIFSFKTQDDYSTAMKYFQYRIKNIDDNSQLFISDQISEDDTNDVLHGRDYSIEGTKSLFKKVISLYPEYPLLGGKVVSNWDKKIIMVCENGIKPPQLGVYQKIIENLANY